MSVLYSIYVLAASVVFFLLPGMLAVRLAAPGKFADSLIAVSLAVGWGVVSFLTFMVTGLVGLVARFHMSLALVAAVAGVLALGGLVAVRVREGNFAFVHELFIDTAKARFSLATFLFLGFVVAVYLLGYDSTWFDQERCITRAAVLPFHDYLSANPPLGFAGCMECFTDRNAFLLWNGGQRQGPAVFIPIFMAVFGFPGFRILHTFFGLLTAWFGYHVGRRMFGRAVPAYLTGFFLAVNPATLSIPLLDENIMALALGTVMFHFLLQTRTQWFFSGMFLGLFLLVRHVGVLSIPAALFAAVANNTKRHYTAKWIEEWLGVGWVPNVVILVFATALFLAPCVITHLVEYWSSGKIYESFWVMPSVSHSFMGIEFSFNGLLSWPFVPEPVRSPYNGFPTLVSFPLTIIQAFGIFGIALLVLGLVWSRKNGRIEVATGMLWFLPQLAVLCVMSNWVEPNKMGVWLSFSQPLAPLIVAGIAALAGVLAPRLTARPWRWVLLLEADRPGRVLSLPSVRTCVITLGAALAVQVTALRLLADYEAPVDERNFKARFKYILTDYPVTFPMITGPEKSYAKEDRQRLTRLSFLPQFNMARPLMVEHLLKLRALQLVRDFAKPFFKDYCEHPKDLVHGLCGIPPPLSHFPGNKGRPDDRRGKWATLGDMMHHPVSSLRDSLGGKRRGCFESGSTVGATRLVRLDLSRPPVENNDFLAAGSESSTPVALNSRILVATDIALPWAAPHPAHLAVIPVNEGYYFMVLFFGAYQFDHLATRPDVQLIDTVAPFVFDFAIPEGSVVWFTETTSVEPNRFHVWDALVTKDEVLLHGPVPSSY